MGNEQSASRNLNGQIGQNSYYGPDRFKPHINENVFNGEANQNNVDFNRNYQNDNHLYVDRFRPNINEQALINNNNVRFNTQEQDIQHIEDAPQVEQNFVQLPLIEVQPGQLYRLHEDTGAQQLEDVNVNPQLLEKIDRYVQKTESQIEQMQENERRQTIIEQLGRISYLEDRMEMLEKEIGNQVFHLKFKHKKALNFQDDFNKLRDETIAHHARVSTFEEDARIRDLSKIHEELEGREADIKAKEQEIDELNEQVAYWRRKANVDDGCISIITSLKFRTSGLIKENNRLKDILYKDEGYSDIRAVIYDSKPIQLQQQIFEETDNLLQDYYESNTYDNVFQEQKSSLQATSKGSKGQQEGQTLQQVQNILSSSNQQSSQQIVTTTTTTVKKSRKTTS